MAYVNYGRERLILKRMLSLFMQTISYPYRSAFDGKHFYGGYEQYFTAISSWIIENTVLKETFEDKSPKKMSIVKKRSNDTTSVWWYAYCVIINFVGKVASLERSSCTSYVHISIIIYC
jgi:hypothetical protein